MDFSSILNSVLSNFAYFIPLVLFIWIAKTPWFKGILGEFIVNTAVRFFLDTQKYHLIKNVTLPTEDGSTQIDHIIVSEFGVFVIETKNMKGWIFGLEHQKQWTQKIFKHTSKFQNPLHQNYKHTKTLSSCLDINEDKLFSVIVFVGDSTFKTNMPENVTYARGLIRFIKSKKSSIISSKESIEITERIQSGRLKSSIKTHRAHAKHVQEIKNKEPIKKQCPKCGNSLILRTAKKGANAGNQFWGCTQYPKCKTVIKHVTSKSR